MKLLRCLILGLVCALAAGPGLTAQIDINLASADQIARTMKGVGPNKAEAIVLYRRHNGPFARIEDLIRVRGIGKKTIEMNRDVISVGAGMTTAKPNSTAH